MSSPAKDASHATSSHDETAALKARVQHLEQTSRDYRLQVERLLQSRSSAGSEAASGAPADGEEFPIEEIVLRGARSLSTSETVDLHDWVTRCQFLQEKLYKTTKELERWKAEALDAAAAASMPSQRLYRSGSKSNLMLGGKSGGAGATTRGGPRRVSLDEGIDDGGDGDAETAAMKLLRRKNAALQRTINLLESRHSEELASRDATIAGLATQLDDVRKVMTGMERDRNEAQQRFMVLQRESLPMQAECAKLSGRVRALEVERRLFMRAAETAEATFDSEVRHVQSREKQMRLVLLQELEQLRAQRDSDAEHLQRAKADVERLEHVVRIVKDELRVTQEALTAAQQLQEQRRIDESLPDLSGGVEAVLKRLEGVVTNAEVAAQHSGQFALAELTRRVTVSETLLKSVDQFSKRLWEREKQLQALLSEIDASERIGWPIRGDDARKVLMDAALEDSLPLPPPREVVLRVAESGWKEIRDVRRNVVYYVTTRRDQTPFESASAGRTEGEGGST